MLGMIGRAHFPANAQAEESAERRWSDWDRGETIFTSSAKRKAESPRAESNVLHAREKSITHQAEINLSGFFPYPRFELT